MKYTIKITFILSLTMIVFGCLDKELESRIAKLEGKIAQLRQKTE